TLSCSRSACLRLDDPLLRPSWTAVALEIVVEPRRGAGHRAIRRRDEGLETLDLVRRLGALHHFHPDARLLGDDLALAVVGAAARAVAHLLGTGLRADVLHAAEHAVAAVLAAEDLLLRQVLEALER